MLRQNSVHCLALLTKCEIIRYHNYRYLAEKLALDCCKSGAFSFLNQVLTSRYSYGTVIFAEFCLTEYSAMRGKGILWVGDESTNQRRSL